jgi:D-3-phosphoglycerate dehydrogenase / 2-oxoglutarate reductase
VPAAVGIPWWFSPAPFIALARPLDLASNPVGTRLGPVSHPVVPVYPVAAGQTDRGAGLDDFETEPLPQDHPLIALPNVLRTSHCAGVTFGSNLIGVDMTPENVANCLNGAPTHVVASGMR